VNALDPTTNQPALILSDIAAATVNLGSVAASRWRYQVPWLNAVKSDAIPARGSSARRPRPFFSFPHAAGMSLQLEHLRSSSFCYPSVCALCACS